MTSFEKLILVTNDDGITAPGIRTLIELMRPFGRVVVVAPDSPQSGMGHAVTINSTLYLNEIGKDEYSCSGTPADCVKLAINEILNRKPDLCVSGINHGSNAAINVIYSGTMSAALEAGIEGIPAIGFSLLDYNWNACFDVAKPYVSSVVQHTITNGLPEGSILNVNLPYKNIKGMKICRQADAYWKEEFDKRINPQGRDYYWLSGNLASEDKSEDTDLWALDHNYVSIVPVQFDLTNYRVFNELKNTSLES